MIERQTNSIEKLKIMKNLKLSSSRIENSVMCYFYIRLTANLNGNPEGQILVINSNAGGSLNQIEIKKEDIYLHKKGVGSAPDLISIPEKYIDLCKFTTY